MSKKQPGRRQVTGLEQALEAMRRKDFSGRPEPRAFDGISDYDNACRLLHWFGSELRYVEDWHEWIYYDGRRWVRDNDSLYIDRCISQTAELVMEEAKFAGSEDSIKALRKCRERLHSTAGLVACRRMARTLDVYGVKSEELDDNTHLFNVANGTLDLRTQAMRGHDPADLITYITDLEYDPMATHPRFEQFMFEAADKDPVLADWLRRWMGYCLTGEVTEEIWTFHYGSGSNGKSTFLEIMMGLVGEYGLMCSKQSFLTNSRTNKGSVPNDLAALRGKRFVRVGETEDNDILDVDRLKDLTGGDTVNARFLFREFFNFRPCAKYNLAGNHKPRILDMTNGSWRRARLAPWTATFKISSLKSELLTRASLEAILPSIVTQARLYYQFGFSDLHPQRLIEATEAYKTEQDQLGEFIRALEHTEDAHAAATRTAVWEAFKDWSRENQQLRFWSRSRVFRELGERGFVVARTPDTRRCFRHPEQNIYLTAAFRDIDA